MNTESVQICDVLILGGGPSGSAMGALLAEKGRRVVVLEKDRHPRFHIGESLLPLSLPYFEHLGIQEEVERIGLRKYAAEFHSMYHGKCTHIRFDGAIDKAYPYAYEVRRSEFDHLLLKNCAAKGADVREGWRVTKAELAGDEISSVTAVDERDTKQRFVAQFYVDATGRDTFLADLLGSKERNRRHKSAALYGHFAGAQRNTGRNEGNIGIHWFDHGWFWMIPLKNGITSVGAVCTPAYLKSRKVPVEQFFFDIIALCPGVQERLSSASLAGPVTATGNYSYESRRMYGRNFLMVGDAYAFIDPVFSSGVHLALRSAFLGAETIDGILRDPDTAPARLKRFETEIRRGLKTFSWFIYRITTPAIRDLFIHPRNILGVREGIVSLLAGDLFRGTPLRFRLFVFRVIYYLKTLFMPRESFAAHRRRRRNLAA